MIRIFCDTHDEADAIWQRLHLADQDTAVSAQIWVADALVVAFTCGDDGRSALHAAPQVRSC